jgi:hypothetical protein
MRSDSRALLTVLGWSVALAVLVLGVAVTAAVGWLSKEAAGYMMLGCLVVGSLVIGRRFGRGLLQQPSRKDEQAAPNAAPDRRGR